MKQSPIPSGTVLRFRNMKATIVECLNPYKHKLHEYRYYVDTDKQRWSLCESDLKEYNYRLVSSNEAIQTSDT